MGRNTSNFVKEEYLKLKGGNSMNSCYNYGGCGCNSYMPTFPCNPFGCSGCGCGCQSFPVMSSCGCGFGSGSGCTWFAIVLVVFLLLIRCV